MPCAPVLAGILFALNAAHPALAEDAVTTRAWAHEGFGRLVFDWSEPVSHTTKTEDGKLVIGFDHPMDVTFDTALERLGNYITAAALEDGGRKAVLTLKPGVSGRDDSEGSLVIIDLVAGGAGHASPQTAADAGSGSTDSIGVRAGEHEDYTRLVFDWRAPVDYTATQDGDEIHIAFDSSKPIDLAAVKADLPPLVTAVSAATSGKKDTVTLKVADGARFRHFRSETKIVVDVLAPANASKRSAEVATRELAPAGGPAPQPPATENDPQETGINPGKPQDTAPMAPPQPPAAAPAPQQTPAPGLKSVPKRAPKAFADSSGGTSVQQSTGIAPPTRLYPQRPQAPSASEPSPSEPSLSGPSASEMPAPSGTPATDAAQPIQSPPPLLKPSPQHAAAEETAPLRPASGLAVAPVPGKAMPGQLAARQTVPGPSVLVKIPPADMATSLKPAANEQVAAVPAEPRRAAPQASPRPAAAAPQAPQRAAAPAAPNLKVTIAGNRNALELRFPWSQPVAAAAYRRAGILWIVFDRPADFDLSVLRRGGGGMIRGADQIPVDGASAVRIKVNPAFNPELRREGEAWIVDLRREELRPRTPVSVNPVALSGQQSRFVVPLARAGREVTIKDPDVGDTIVVLPVLVPGQGIATTHDYPLFRLLATAQGVAIEAKADGLEMRATPDGLEIIGKNGLFLSGEKVASTQNAGASQPPSTSSPPQTQAQSPQTTTQTDAEAAAAAASSTGPLYDFDAWAHKGVSFEDEREQLEYKAADASGDARNEARLDLAKFYFARGYAAEALGLLHVIAGDDPGYADRPVFHAISGAAHYLMGDYAAAAKDLAAPDLANDGQAAVWRGAVAVKQQDWPAATQAFAVAGDRIPTFPVLFRPRLALAAAESSLMSNQFGAMKTFIGMAKTDPPVPADEARAKYIEGLAAEKQGNDKAALALFEAATTHGDQEITVRATFSKVTMLLGTHKMQPADAIKTLESLRYVWRGDAFEFDLLRKLGELYLSQNEYEKGLRTLRRAVTLFPTIDGAQAVTQEMSAAFNKLYVDGVADGMPPIKALGLYQDFRELTPTGAPGDIMIQKLAERLISIDLLDQAADLLQQQVQYRLQGEPKARIGARLASVWLLDKAPDKAYQALAESNVGNLPPDLVTERRHLEARALAQMGKLKEAFADLKGDDSPAADTIRADALWDKHDWAGAAKALTRLAAAIPAGEAKLSDDQSVTVLRLAVALWLANDQTRLNAVRQQFASRMNETPYSADFRVIAAAPSDDIQSVQAVTKRLDEVDEYGAFLKALQGKSQGKSKESPQVANATSS